MRDQNSSIASRRGALHLTWLSGLWLLSLMGCALPIKPAALSQVKTIAVVGLTQVDNMAAAQQPGSQGVTGFVNAVKTLQKQDSGRAQAEAKARTEQSHALLSQRLKDGLGWQVLSKDELSSSEKFRSTLAQQTRTLPTDDAATLLQTGGQLRLADLTTRRAILDALGVDAVATAFVTYDVGKTSGFSIGGMGKQKRHPRATVRFAVYDRQSPEPIWFEQAAAGQPAPDGIEDIMGVSSTADATPLFLAADTSAYDQLLDHFRRMKQRADQQAAKAAAQAAPAPAPAPAPTTAPPAEAPTASPASAQP